MTDLTECWEKGTLEKDRDYYITFFDNFPFIAKFKYHDAMIPYWKFEKNGIEFCDKNGYNCVKVLAEVPSYEEYQQLKEYERIVTSYNMKPIDYDIACETVNKLLDDNKRLKHDVGNLGYKIKNQRHEIDNRLKEIEKLKELLRECKRQFEEVELCRYDVADTDQEDWFKISTEQAGIANKMIAKIDEVLKCGNIK